MRVCSFVGEISSPRLTALGATLATTLAVSLVSCSKSNPENNGPSSTQVQSTTNPQPKQTTDSSKSSTSSEDPGHTHDPGATPPPNFLVIIADDLGVDVLKSSGISNSPANTPHLDRLASEGLIFDNFWVTPACTTTRGALISGQHGFLSGIDYVPAVMPNNTATLQQRLKAADIPVPYATGLFGKWHLGGGNADPNHPGKFGIDRYAGNLFNVDDYSKWTLTQNGQQSESTDYHTSKVVDLSLDFIRSQPENQPWFAWVAFVAPHPPFHAPPEKLVSKAPKDTAPSQYKAMVESMDSEIGRLVAGLPDPNLDNTVLIFLGDNGTPEIARDRDIFPKGHVKGTIYEGGIRAPMLVAGAAVKRRGEREKSMVNVTDIFATLTGLASTEVFVPSIPKHSLSFAPLLERAGQSTRTFNYSEWKNGAEFYWTVRDENHKLIVFPQGDSQLFATDDLAEANPIEDAAITQRLLNLGKGLRDGSISPGKEEKYGSFCSMFSGTRMHEGKDIARDKSFVGQIQIAQNAEVCEIIANGIPDHQFNDGKRVFNHPVAEQEYRVRVPLQPKLNPTPTPLSLVMDNALLLNGAKVDLLAAACYGVGDGKIGCGDLDQPWRFDPMFIANGFAFDNYFAHTQASGAYHYHGVGAWAKTGGILGVAADGFAIHSSNVTVSGIERTLRSSYRLKAGARVQSDPNAPFPGGNYDGTFRDDWEYVPGLGDLDECNGMMLNGQYMYFATEEYPYFLGCFRATPDPSFNKRGAARSHHAHEPGMHSLGTGRHQHHDGPGHP